MGHESFVYGCIRGATLRSGTTQYYDLHPLNRAVINNLPETDDWPFFTRSLFSYPGDDVVRGRYRSQIIHFGGSFKQIESDWEEWLEKFESLLRRLYWKEARLHLETESVGSHSYTWMAKVGTTTPSDTTVTPTVDWTFTGGPRRFDP